MATSPAPTRGHPKSLYLLFATEMWERMSFFGMRSLLVLYIVDTVRGGLGWSNADALNIYGIYTSLSYLTPVFGGYLCDRFLGLRRGIIIGSFLMMVGQFLLAASLGAPTLFYAGLVLLIIGNGLFKSNISTLVGALYAPGDPRRDSAFTIFYIGINAGALMGSTICGYLGEEVAWSWGFASAGIGMGLGLTTFVLLGQRMLGDLGLKPVPLPREEVKGTSTRLTRQEIDRIIVIFVVALFVIFFWAAFEQSGGLMTLYTNTKVDRFLFGWEVPTTLFQGVNPVFVLLLGPVFATLWSALARRRKDPSIPVKMALGLMLVALGFAFMLGAAKQGAAGEKAAMGWVIAAYFFHTAGELCLSPVGLSMVTKLAPTRYASALMGVWFFANSIAYYLAGFIGGYAEKLGEFSLFLSIAIASASAGVVLLAVSPMLKRMMHGADEVRPTEPPSAPGGPSSAQPA